ncbi:hypothetical protein LDC_1731, partial [sediment metagenome]
MIETLEQFNEAYRRLKESPRGEWFHHKEFPLARDSEWFLTVLETHFNPHARRISRSLTEDEAALELDLEKSRNEKTFSPRFWRTSACCPLISLRSLLMSSSRQIDLTAWQRQ